MSFIRGFTVSPCVSIYLIKTESSSHPHSRTLSYGLPAAKNKNKHERQRRMHIKHWGQGRCVAHCTFYTSASLRSKRSAGSSWTVVASSSEECSSFSIGLTFWLGLGLGLGLGLANPNPNPSPNPNPQP